MSWARKQNGIVYYERARRVGGKVVNEYIGRGRAAEMVALMDAQRRVEREARCREAQIERERLKTSVKPVVELATLIELLVKGSLLVAGFHQHDRGEWRLRNGKA
ncbi:MAG: hypothetical protein ABI614_10445 [Planctomycetota bacterium]